MGSRDGDPKMFCDSERDGSCSFGAHSLKSVDLSDFSAHGFDNLPAPTHSPQCNSRVTGQRNPFWHRVTGFQVSAGHHRDKNNTHYLLGVVPTMGKTQRSRRYQLQLSEPPLRNRRSGPFGNIDNGQGEYYGNYHPYQRSKYNKRNDFEGCSDIDRTKHAVSQNESMCHPGTSESTDQRVGGA